MTKILSCGELKNSVFCIEQTKIRGILVGAKIARDSKEDPSINSASPISDKYALVVQKLNKQTKNKLNKKIDNIRTYKLAPGSKVLNIENKKDLMEIVLKYSNDPTKTLDPKTSGPNDLIEAISKDYQGIYVHKSVIDKNPKLRAITGEKAGLRVLDFTAVRHGDDPNPAPFRKGMNGSDKNLSKEGKKIDNDAHKVRENIEKNKKDMTTDTELRKQALSTVYNIINTINIQNANSNQTNKGTKERYDRYGFKVETTNDKNTPENNQFRERLAVRNSTNASDNKNAETSSNKNSNVINVDFSSRKSTTGKYANLKGNKAIHVDFANRTRASQLDKGKVTVSSSQIQEVINITKAAGKGTPSVEDAIKAAIAYNLHRGQLDKKEVNQKVANVGEKLKNGGVGLDKTIRKCNQEKAHLVKKTVDNVIHVDFSQKTKDIMTAKVAVNAYGPKDKIDATTSHGRVPLNSNVIQFPRAKVVSFPNKNDSATTSSDKTTSNVIQFPKNNVIDLVSRRREKYNSTSGPIS